MRHPTYPESAARATGTPLSETTANLLADWNERVPGLAGHVTPEGPVNLSPYADGWREGDLVAIPERDLPPGCPPWWRDLLAWADRDGASRQEKRATIRVAVPRRWQTWPRL